MIRMRKGFKRSEVEDLLVKCHRRCCVCHRFCGSKIEIDHIEPWAQSNDNNIENAIPVCFDCHAEIRSYNDQHPRGRKFTARELKGHREQWLDICKTHPELLTLATSSADSGPIQGMLDELEFNLTIGKRLDAGSFGVQFRDEQLKRALREGTMAMLPEDLKETVSMAYAVISRTNQKAARLANIQGFAVYDEQRSGYQEFQALLPMVEKAVMGLKELLRPTGNND